jgi:NCS2 family nucleobase:cation symporter-2
MTCALSLGIGAILVPNWFSYFFTYSGPNKALSGFLDAITLLMEAGYAVAGVVSLILHLMLPEESEIGERVTEGAEPSGRDMESGVIKGPPDEGIHRKSVSSGSDPENRVSDLNISKME